MFNTRTEAMATIGGYIDRFYNPTPQRWLSEARSNTK
jgi:hypothetical protein